MKDKPFIFVLVGGLNTLFGFLLFTFLYFLLIDLFSKFFIVAISTLISIIFSHFTQRSIVWKSNKNYFKEFLTFSSWYLMILVINLILLYVFTDFYKFNTLLTQYVISGVLIGLMFFVQKLFIFK